jgi:plasmid stabilization system protein ParE
MRCLPSYGLSMAFRVDITPRARLDLDKIYARLAREAPNHLSPWSDRFEQSILSLSELPERCQVEPKLSTARRTVRRLLLGGGKHVYRIYFTIIGDVVRVIHVRHGARRELKRL